MEERCTASDLEFLCPAQDGIWCDVFLFMFGTDIRVYDMFDATDPDDCVLIINTIDQTSGEIVAVSNASPFSHQPHCIAIAGSSVIPKLYGQLVAQLSYSELRTGR